jgi:hypothetical protein
MTRPDEICAACGSATGHAGYGDDSIGYCGGTIGPLCDECNQRLRLEVEADGDLQAEIDCLRRENEHLRGLVIRNCNPSACSPGDSRPIEDILLEAESPKAETDQLCGPGKGVTP